MAGRLTVRSLLAGSALRARRRSADVRGNLVYEDRAGLGRDRHRMARLGRVTHYRTRFLGCLAASLLVMIAAAHVPIGDGWSRVGWYVVPAAESISIDLLDLEHSEHDPQQGALVTQFDDAGAPSPPDGEPPRDESRDLIAEADSFSAPPLERLSGRRVFEAAQDMPQIVGGLGAYYIHIEYPQEALVAGVQGRLILSFVVETDGRTTGVEVIRALHPACDSAAVRALRRTRFVPGRQNGELVPVRMHLPVRFKIVDSDEGLTAAQATDG